MPTTSPSALFHPVRFERTGDQTTLHLIDQTELPSRCVDLVCTTVKQAHAAISRLVVRGAPAIGIAAAYAVCLTANEKADATKQDFAAAIDHLATSRPTAVNLFWALDRIRQVLEHPGDDQTLLDRIILEAQNIHREDLAMGQAIGLHGAELLRGSRRVLTHCNAGGLATSGWGTALAPIYRLHCDGQTIQVYAGETRPLMQGARLTAWELSQCNIPVTVITDSMAGWLMQTQNIDAVIVGADRIAANGDAANKIGTYSLAILAKHHGIPFYVAAPSSTFDLSLPSGDAIPIEQRGRDEVTHHSGGLAVPDQAGVLNPAFDVTPANLIAAIVTERGNIHRPDQASVAKRLA